MAAEPTYDELMNEYKALFRLAAELLMADPYRQDGSYARAGEALEAYISRVESGTRE